MTRGALVVLGACLCAGTTAPAFAAPTDPSISAQLVTTSPQVGKSLTIDGTVQGATGTVAVTRTDSAGDTPLSPPAMIQSDGTFEVNDTPAHRGAVSYDLKVNGTTPETTVQANVAGEPTSLTVHVKASRVPSGTVDALTVHVAGDTGRDVSVTATPYKLSSRHVSSGNTDSSGDYKTAYDVKRRTRFTVSVAADDTYARATKSLVVTVRGVVKEKLRGGYAKHHGYRFFKPSADPSILVQLLPTLDQVCIAFRAQRFYDGHWHTTSYAKCPTRTDSNARVVGVLHGDHVIGEHYRVRAEWHGNKAALSRYGAWLKLEFTTR
jgi:hypothetical protein